MWTNVFKIVSFQNISWFQFLPQEVDSKSLHDKGVKARENDYARFLVVRSHLQLQKDGFLSSWTNSFNGPWDPSQGIYNPDDKIKLWLFVPGRHLAVIASAQAALSGLRGVSCGIWSAPGDSEEVSAALSQALRNRIERALSGLGYIRFGDVFSRCKLFSEDEEVFRKGRPAIEFIFSSTEEAIFVHVILSTKRIRAISVGDVEKLLNHSFSNKKFPVIVPPHGMHGYLSGCYPVDVVNQAYLSVHGEVDVKPEISRGPSYQTRGSTYCIEVTFGCCSPLSKTVLNSMPKYHAVESERRADRTAYPDCYSFLERTFIYPIETVMVPSMQFGSASTFLKRFWMRNWTRPSLSGSTFFMHCSDAMVGDKIREFDVSSEKQNWMHPRYYSSSSNSNNSSFSSSTSSSTCSECKHTATIDDIDADADSITCRQSIICCSSDQFENKHNKLGAKRPRTETLGTLVHVEKVPNASKSGIGSSEVNGSIITGTAGDPTRSHWDWDDDDKGVGMDIQTLLSEFGDFGDFFENDNLPFGEPPGTAESEARMCSTQDYGDIGSSPCTGVMDASEFLPVGFPSFEGFNAAPSALDECLSKNQDGASSVTFAGQMDHPAQSSEGETDHAVMAEALLTFAPEYGAVEAFSPTIFGSLYMPDSRRAETQSSNVNYIYGPKPPNCFGGSDEKPCTPEKSRDLSSCLTGLGANNMPVKKYYTCIQMGRNCKESPTTCAYSTIRSSALPSSPLATSNCINQVKLSYGNVEDTNGEGCFVSSSRVLFSSEIECIMFQASICGIRHILAPLNGIGSSNGSILAGTMGLSQLCTEVSTLQDASNEHETMRNETVPVRISGDIDEIIQGQSLNWPVGVWRAVGGMNSSKAASPSTDLCSSLPHNSNSEESLLSDKFQQPLQDLLDGLPLLVQQATSFVDLPLDADFVDGVHGLLALQETQWRSFCCSPSSLHAGCGGTLASNHSFDVAGLELFDPFAADIHPSTVISLLQSDIKVGLKAAFGTLDGPLAVSDWCEGHSQSGDMATMVDGYSLELAEKDGKNLFCGTNISRGEPLSPSPSLTGGLSSLHASSNTDGNRVDETCQRKSIPAVANSELELRHDSRLRPSVVVLPEPAILVGYQDDWLKTSTSSLQLWEKAPLEPYALQKPVTYCVICPDIDPLTSAATDFFHQLGSVYEMCNLGTHFPQILGNEAAVGVTKAPTGFILLDCPQSMKIEGGNASLMGSISDYFLSLSHSWDLSSFLVSVSGVLKALKLGSWLVPNTKEGNRSSTVAIYVVCPFPEVAAVLETVVKASIAIGSTFLSNEKEKRSHLYAQVGKALNVAGTTDEAVDLITLSGFCFPRLVLQVLTVDAIFRVTTPSLNELVLLKEIAFTVFNKARRVARWMTTDSWATPLQNKSTSPGQGIWKEYSATQGTSSASKWDGSWQTQRTSDILHHMFEPLFILADSGSVDSDTAPDAVQSDATQPSIHCCYGWTEDWRWMTCIWTDSRGELLDAHIFPFGGISSRQDTKGLQCLFIQLLQQGCQILQSCSIDPGIVNSRDFIIARIGSFYDLEYQEWQKALSDLKKWPLQLRNGALYPPSQSAARKGGLFHWIRSIALVTVSVDHTLQLVSQSDPSSGAYVEGFTAVGSLGSISATHILIPSPCMRFLVHPPLQLPTCLTADSPPLAHLLHSKGYAVPLATGFVVSRAVTRRGGSKEWPSVLLVSLVDYHGDVGAIKGVESGDKTMCARGVLETAAAELHALSWMSVSPAFLERRTPLPVHCDIVLRLRRLLHFADTSLRGQGGRAPPLPS